MTSEAQEGAERRATARAEEKAKAEEAREVSLAPEQAESRWNAMAVLKGLAKLRAKERGGKRLRLIAALPTDLTAVLASKKMCWPGVGRRPLWLGFLLFSALWYFNLKHPDLLSPAQVQTALHRLIEGAGKTIFSR